MTPEEADSRITLSRQMLARYIAMTTAGVDPLPGTLMLVHDEIAILEGVGEEHPGKVRQLVALATKWIAFGERMQKKLH